MKILKADGETIDIDCKLLTIEMNNGAKVTLAELSTGLELHNASGHVDIKSLILSVLTLQISNLYEG